MRVTDDHSSGCYLGLYFGPFQSDANAFILYFYCYIYILHVCNVNQNIL